MVRQEKREEKNRLHLAHNKVNRKQIKKCENQKETNYLITCLCYRNFSLIFPFLLHIIIVCTKNTIITIKMIFRLKKNMKNKKISPEKYADIVSVRSVFKMTKRLYCNKCSMLENVTS